MDWTIFKKAENLEPEYQRPITKWWAFSIQDVYKRLGVDSQGLTEENVFKIQAKTGFNDLPEIEENSLLTLLVRQLNSPIILVLIIAGSISFLMSDYIDSGVIFLGTAVNVLVGFYQEFKAKKALLSLKKIVVNYAKVLRNGQQELIDSKELVQGDIVLINAGDKVPADLRLIKTSELKINEALLTGEVEPREKNNKILVPETVLSERFNVAFMGSIVVGGSAVGVVVETGLNSEIGRLSNLTANITKEDTPLQISLRKLAKFLSKTVVLVAISIFLLGLFLGYDIRQIFVIAVAVAVATIPEGMAVVVTVILAIGMQRILKSNVLVKHMLAAEVLGSTTVICADKTGTLTEGKMQVVKLATEDHDFNLRENNQEFGLEAAAEQEFLLKIGVLCNNGQKINQDNTRQEIYIGDLTEQALLRAGEVLGLEKNGLEKEQTRLDEIPFSSTTKFMMTLHKFDQEFNIIYLKGAPEKILFFSEFIYSNLVKQPLELNSHRREKILKIYENMSREGLRVLAVAYKKVKKDIKIISQKIPENLAASSVRQPMAEIYTNFIFVGLIGIKDPVRTRVKETLSLTKKAGIQTVIITGDNKYTAEAMAKEAGLEIKAHEILEGDVLEKMSETDLKSVVKDIKMYSRTTPEQKLKIVRAWQDNGAVVAMTGDGINDAPALKQADIGLTPGNATDVAKEAADLILLDNNFINIIEAIRQGRIIFANIKKTILYLLSSAFVELVVILIALILKWPLPILASQLIWVNLIADTLPALALANDEADDNILLKKNSKQLIDAKDKLLIMLICLASAFLILISFKIFYNNQESNLDLARTMAFMILGVSSLFYVFSLRNLKIPFWQTKFWQNKFLIAGIIIGLFFQILTIYNSLLQKIFMTVNLNFWHWLYVFSSSFLLIGMIEFIKWIYNKKTT